MAKNIRIRPSKPAMIISLVVMFIFVLIGIFIVIPTSGLFGIFWTLIAVCGFVTNLMGLVSKKGGIGTNIVIDDDCNGSKNSIEDRLYEVENLFRKGLISQDELEEKRKKILEEL